MREQASFAVLDETGQELTGQRAGGYKYGMQPESRPRLFFIDNLRIGLIVLVVAHHVGQAYGPTGGWWYFSNPERAAVLGAFFTVNRSFFMSLFFMISGYFLPQSLDRKGRGFLKDRFSRLGIPLLAFVFAIIPVMMYAYHVNFRPYGPTPFLSYLSRFYFGHGSRPPHWNGPAWPDVNFGHLWFIEHLLIFAVCYRLWRLMPFSGTKIGCIEGRPPRSVEIIAFAVVLAAITFVVRLWYPIDRWIGLLKFIQVAFADVPRDLAFFVIGVIAYRRNWFLAMPKKAGKIWLFIGLAAAVFCYSLFFTGHAYFNGGGPTLGAFIFDLWEVFLCCGMCIGLMVLFRERLNRQGWLAKDLAASTYAVYLFHVPVVVALQYAVGHVALGPLMKFFLVTLIAIPATFVIGSALRRAPLARSIL
jgi:peptidoglycan/LPS O-acetylase OafA/YrhL